MGEEAGSILWSQSPGVARLLPAGKREFGEISAADVPDITVERQHQQGMYLPDENVVPPPPTTEFQGALPGPCQSVPVLRGPRDHVSDTSRPLCLPDLAWLDFLACWAGKWGQGSHFWCSHILKHTHIHKIPMVPSPTSKLDDWMEE